MDEIMREGRWNIVKELNKMNELDRLQETHHRQLNNQDRRLFFHSFEFEEPAEEYFWDDYDLTLCKEPTEEYFWDHYSLSPSYEELAFEDIESSTQPTTRSTEEQIRELHDIIKAKTVNLGKDSKKKLWQRLVARITKTIRMKSNESEKKQNGVIGKRKQTAKGHLISRPKQWISEKINRRIQSVRRQIRSVLF